MHSATDQQGSSLHDESDQKSQKDMERYPDKETSAATDTTTNSPVNDDDSPVTSTTAFVLTIASIFSAMFLTSLDKLIISTAIPQITNEFSSQNDVGWYGAAYLITNCSFQLVFGKLYKFLPTKPLFLGSLLLFEVGSAICGAAPNSIALILGRAIAGLGAGGMVTGIFMILVFTVSPQKRPIYQGYFGVLFGISSILGPTIGGALTSHATWRWCFYINLPIGAIIGVFIILFLHLPNKPGPKLSLKDKIWQINPLGTFLIVSGTVLLCLALQWGGITYPWNDGRVIAVLVISLALLAAFIGVQFWLPDQAILPPSILLQRSIAAGFWTTICLGGHQTIFPIQGKSAVESGIDLLAMLLPFAAISLAVGHLISRVGYYTPFLIAGVCITAVGAGMLTTLKVNSSTHTWASYQVLYSIGLGFSGQIPSMAAYTVLEKENAGIGTSLVFFGQTLFGAIFIAVGQSVLDQQLKKRLAAVPGVKIGVTGVTDILHNIPTQDLALAKQGYNDALSMVFRVALYLACIGVLGAFFMEWRTVKNHGPHEKSLAEKTNDPEKRSPDASVNEIHGTGDSSEKAAKFETHES